jgi:CheY-like chemotaxis protein
VSVKVLIIDDDEDDRELFRYALSNVNSHVTCVEAIDGEDGLRLLQKNSSKPDYIFLDLNMPRIDGILFLKKMRRDCKLRDIPVIVYTTSKFQNDKEKCVELGAVHFITKPTTLTEIEAAISFVLERKWEPIIH